MRGRTGAKLLALMLPRQVGKTHFGVWCIRETMRQNTNAMTIFLAKDFPSIKRNTQDKFLKLFPETEFNVTSQGVNYSNPTQAKFRGACFTTGVDKNPHKIRGGTMHFIHWSEVAFSQFQKGETFRSIHQTVVLPMISRTFGYYLMESTPFGSNFWKDFWESDSRDPESLSRDFVKICFTLDLCISLGAITREQADFMERSMHPDVFKQEMLCLFVTFMGKVYKEFDAEKHCAVITPEPHEKIILGMDIGHTAGFSCLFGVWRGEELFIFDQIYQQGLRIGQMVDLVEQRMAFWNIPRDNYSAYSDHDPEMLAELQGRRIKVDLADKLDPFACRMSIKEGFYFDKIKINPLRCEPLIKEVDSAVWSQTKADDMAMGGDPNDGHWDSEASLRYLYRGSKLQFEKPEEAPDGVKADQKSLEEWDFSKGRREIKKERDKALEAEGVKRDPGGAIVFEY